MSVGIYTRYSHCDEAYLALRIASFLKEKGGDFSIYSSVAPVSFKTGYDACVTHKAVKRFTDWAAGKATIVWTHVPPAEQIMWARKKGAQTVLAPMWQDLQQPFRRAIRRADTVVALSKASRDLFRDVYKFKNVLFIPFDAGVPLVKKKKQVDPQKIKLVLPWFDRNARCAQISFLLQLERIVTLMPQAELTVCVTSSKFSPSISKFFKRLNNVTNGRVRVLRGVSFRERPLLFTSADLTVFPAECDNYGFIGLTSLNLGTPVVSFATPPQNEFIYSDINGVLVKTDIDYDENGVPHANPDYNNFAAVLQALIAEPEMLDKLNVRATHNLEARRRSFDLGWNLFFK